MLSSFHRANAVDAREVNIKEAIGNNCSNRVLDPIRLRLRQGSLRLLTRTNQVFHIPASARLRLFIFVIARTMLLEDSIPFPLVRYPTTNFRFLQSCLRRLTTLSLGIMPRQRGMFSWTQLPLAHFGGRYRHSLQGTAFA
jgi:hypothetical protein